MDKSKKEVFDMRIRMGSEIFKVSAIASMCYIMNGCGTISTIAYSDESVERNLKKSNSYCESIPRIYSGVFYDACQLHANPVGSSYYVPDWLFLYGADAVASIVADTVLLPYTIYKQANLGSIKID